MRKDLVQFMHSAQVKSVGFHLGSVYEDPELQFIIEGIEPLF